MNTDTPTAQAEPTRQSFFSIDEENFNHETKWEAMDAMDEEDRLHLGAEYEEALFEHADARDAFDAQELVDRSEEWLSDNSYLGEDGDYFTLFSADARAELNQLLRDWHDKHKPNVILWKPVGKTITHTVTAEDLAEFYAGNPSEGE
jgi:hypothetical protein